MRRGVVRGITIAVALAAALACTRKPADDDRELDPVSGTFTLDEETWYAKDVGVVKSVVSETFKLKQGGDEDRARVTTELQAFTH